MYCMNCRQYYVLSATVVKARSAGCDFPCELLSSDGSGGADCTTLLYPLRFPGTHGVAHKYTPSPSFLPFSSSPLPLSPLSPQLEMSGPPQVEAKQSKWQVKRKLRKAYDVVTLHLSKHTGVGFVCAVAYFDPYVCLFLVPVRCLTLSSGNWGVDLQAGSEYGYKLLFIVLLAGIFAVLLQVWLLLP